jgi:hypothetical protein
MAVMCALLLAGMAVQWVWKRFKARRARIEREREAVDQRLRELFGADDTVPTDVIDKPWVRADREIHHMTASEFTEINSEFAALIAANWPDPT